MATTKIIGYVVKNSYGEFVAHDPEGAERGGRSNFLTDERPAPVSKPDAYRRLAAYLDEIDNSDPENSLYVAPVFHEPTPLEKASAELGSLLQGLCNRHGLNLGLTQDEVEKQIAKELEALGAGGASFVATGIPRMR